MKIFTAIAVAIFILLAIMSGVLSTNTTDQILKELLAMHSTLFCVFAMTILILYKIDNNKHPKEK